MRRHSLCPERYLLSSAHTFVALLVLWTSLTIPGAHADPKRADDVCVATGSESLERFIRSYRADANELYARRGFDPSELEVYGAISKDDFDSAMAKIVSLYDRTVLAIYHVDEAAICVFAWYSKELGSSNATFHGRPTAETGFFYDHRPVNSTELSSIIRQIADQASRELSRGALRAPLKRALKPGDEEMKRGMGQDHEADTPAKSVTDLIDGLVASIELPEMSKALERSSSLVLYLPGDLAFLPLYAIPLDGKRPLVETHDVVLLDQLTSFLGVGSGGDPTSMSRQNLEGSGGQSELNMRLGFWPAGLPSHAAVIGDPETSNADFGSMIFPRLEGARREAHKVAELLGVDVIEGPDATAGRVVEAIVDADLVHYSGHGVASEVDPLNESFLALTDGPFSARDIQSLNVSGSLVVLSACDTGRGQAMGAGIIGLARAFERAGALGVVVSHWPVSDVSAAVLMEQFYRELGRNKPSVALRRAAMTLRGTFPNVADWAAFSYVGVPLLNEASAVPPQ